jgi:hypothetical protein
MKGSLGFFLLLISLQVSAQREVFLGQAFELSGNLIENGYISGFGNNLIPVDTLLKYSMKYLGTPYRYGGRTEKGFDCSGFVYYVYKKFGIELPQSSRTQVAVGAPVSLDSVKRGDLLFFRGRNLNSPQIGHVAIVVDVSQDSTDVQMIHSTRQGLKLDWLRQQEYYQRRYVTSRRLSSFIETPLAKKDDNPED